MIVAAFASCCRSKEYVDPEATLAGRHTEAACAMVGPVVPEPRRTTAPTSTARKAIGTATRPRAFIAASPDCSPLLAPRPRDRMTDLDPSANLVPCRDPIRDLWITPPARWVGVDGRTGGRGDPLLSQGVHEGMQKLARVAPQCDNPSCAHASARRPTKVGWVGQRKMTGSINRTRRPSRTRTASRAWSVRPRRRR